MNTPKPPTKLSDLIDLAIRDGRGLDPNVYAPDASRWHEPSPDSGQCYVCLAGAVIAGTLGANPAEEVGRTSFLSGKPRCMRWIALGKETTSPRLRYWSRHPWMLSPGCPIGSSSGLLKMCR